MQAEQIQSLIENVIADADVSVTIDGSHAHLDVVSDTFEGLNAVKRQQLVYGALQALIASGELHAVHMKTKTRAEQAAKA